MHFATTDLLFIYIIYDFIFYYFIDCIYLQVKLHVNEQGKAVLKGKKTQDNFFPFWYCLSFLC